MSLAGAPTAFQKSRQGCTSSASTSNRTPSAERNGGRAARRYGGLGTSSGSTSAVAAATYGPSEKSAASATLTRAERTGTPRRPERAAASRAWVATVPARAPRKSVPSGRGPPLARPCSAMSPVAACAVVSSNGVGSPAGQPRSVRSVPRARCGPPRPMTVSGPAVAYRSRATPALPPGCQGPVPGPNRAPSLVRWSRTTSVAVARPAGGAGSRWSWWPSSGRASLVVSCGSGGADVNGSSGVVRWWAARRACGVRSAGAGGAFRTTGDEPLVRLG